MLYLKACFFLLFAFTLNPNTILKVEMMDEAILGSAHISIDDKEGIGLMVLNTVSNEMYLIASLDLFLSEESNYLAIKKKWSDTIASVKPYYKDYTTKYIQQNIPGVNNADNYEMYLDINLLKRQSRIVFQHGKDICAILINGDKFRDNVDENPAVGFKNDASFIGSYYFNGSLPDLSRDVILGDEMVRLPENHDLINFSPANFKSNKYIEQEKSSKFLINVPETNSEIMCKPVFHFINDPNFAFQMLQFQGIQNGQGELFDKSIIEQLIK